MRYAYLLAAPLVVLGAQPATPQAPTAVNVQLSNFKFMPRTIVLDRGKSYALRLYNASGGAHDFSSRTFFAAAVIAPSDRRWVIDGEVEVPPGQLREIRLTAPAAGRHKLKCTHRFHKTLGMSGAIIVR
jgi:uncharacterized cupredoxin-like copper-binding protein